MVTHGKGSEGETGELSGYVKPFTLSRKLVYPALLPLMAHLGCQQSTELTPPANLDGLVPFAKRRNLDSARVPSLFKRSLLHKQCNIKYKFLET